jgi:transposase
MTEEALKVIANLQEKNEEISLENERLACERNEQTQKLELLQEQINDLLHRLYGRKSERFENPNQLDLLKQIGWSEGEEPETKLADLEKVSYTRKRPKKRGPKAIPEHLPRIKVLIDPNEAERVCACCSKDMERVDEVVTEELDIVPPQFRVKQYVQGKWRCHECMNRDLVEPLPARPIQKGRPSPSLLAYIVVSKYLDHQPLYRQEQIFKRHGIHLARSTMDEWLGQLSQFMLPIVGAMKRRFRAEAYLQCDETPIQALEHEGRGKKKKKGNERKKQVRRCYLWAYSIPRGEVIYDVTASRSSRGPCVMLDGFFGTLQTDGYAGYNELFKSGDRLRVACMAHIRRKFKEARHALPERVDEILDLIRDLYAIEEDSRETKLDYSERLEIREDKSRPIFTKLKSKIDELAPIPVPKSKLGKAVSYAQGQWSHMERYLDDGLVEIDNNWCEQAIRPTVLGRKNYLFLGSLEGGGRRAKVFYTLLQSAKRIGLEPFEYFRDVLERLPTHSQSRIDELTPRGWAEARQQSENASDSTAL